MAKDSEDSAELAYLSAMRAARARFFARLADHAATHAPEDKREPDGRLSREFLALIRSEGAAQIAEFYFVIDELDLGDGRRFRRFIENHNAAMEGYLAAPDEMRRVGVSPQRIGAARFSEQQITFIETVSPAGSLCLDQTSLGRLLVEIMAPESCRKIAVALADGGLLERRAAGPMLIRSTGLLEGLYRDQLRDVVTAIGGGR